MSWRQASFQGYSNPIVLGDGWSEGEARAKFKAALVKIAKGKSLEEFTKWAKGNIVIAPERIEEAYSELSKTHPNR